jgi:hypothetical protein
MYSDKLGIIYKVTNRLNKKVYIGQTVKSLEKRKLEHINTSYRGRGFYFHRALRKYSSSAFIWEILGEGLTKDERDSCEKTCIEFFDSTNPIYGYNVHIGGTGGDTITKNINKEEIRKKISISCKNLSNDKKLHRKEAREKSYERNNSKINAVLKLKETLLNNPEIKINAEKKRLFTIKNKYDDFYTYITKKRMQTEKAHPEIQEKRTLSYKTTLKKNPEITIKKVFSFKETLSKNPDIMKKLIKKREKFLEQNPNFLKKVNDKRLEYERQHPEIQKKRTESYKRTLINNPEIAKNRGEKYKKDCALRNDIKSRCEMLIKNNSNIVVSINPPSNHKGSKVWEDFEKTLILMLKS